MNLREERIQELTDLIAAQMPARTIQFTPTEVPSAFLWYSANAEALAPVVLDQSPRARAWRAIQRIASRYHWGEFVVTRALDRFHVHNEYALSDSQIDELLAEMERHNDRAMHACDDEYAPPAR